MASAKNVQDLVSAAVSMPGGGSAELYSDTAAQVCRRSLDELFSEITPLGLYEQQTVLDIGCGTGEATMSLLDRLPQADEICAVDKSREFIEYAKEGNDCSEIYYKHMDVEEEWPQSWSNKFSLVFSNYVLHWIKDHQKLLMNMNSCMKVNGDFIAQFFHSAMQTNDEMMAAKKAAQDCGITNEMQNAIMTIRKQTPIWKDVAEYSKQIKSLGFRVKTCKVEERHYVCKSKFERAGMTVTVSPFMNHVPTEKKLLFATKYVSYLKDPFTIHHKAVIVHAIKVQDC